MTDKKKQNDKTPTDTADILKKVRAEHGEGSIMRFDGSQAETPVAIVPSGSLALDRALGIGGYPRGRITEIYGPESSGKTTLTLHAIAEVQRQGGTAAFIDAEHAFDLRYAKTIGVDTAKLLISQPDCGEQALGIADMLIKSSEIDLVVIDSVAALVPRVELEGNMGDPVVGLHARLMSQALRKLAHPVETTGTAVIFINQLRQKIGVMFGSPETTTGGQALKFYSSVRIDIRRIAKVTIDERIVGNRVRTKIVKNKMAAPYGEAEFEIRWGVGIDAAGDALDVATTMGVVKKSGAYYSFDGKNLGQGREKARETFVKHPELYGAIREAAFGPKKVEAIEVDEKKVA